MPCMHTMHVAVSRMRMSHTDRDAAGLAPRGCIQLHVSTRAERVCLLESSYE